MHVGKIVKHHKRLKKIEIEVKCLIHNNFKTLNTKKNLIIYLKIIPLYNAHKPIMGLLKGPKTK